MNPAYLLVVALQDTVDQDLKTQPVGKHSHNWNFSAQMRSALASTFYIHTVRRGSVEGYRYQLSRTRTQKCKRAHDPSS